MVAFAGEKQEEKIDRRKTGKKHQDIDLSENKKARIPMCCRKESSRKKMLLSSMSQDRPVLVPQIL